MTPTPALEARGVSFRYSRRPDAYRFDGWDAAFQAGCVTALTGPSGCGKSTRLYLLGLMLRISSGQILVNGDRADSLTDAARAALRAHAFGFVFQDAALDPSRSVLDNIIETALYRGEHPARWTDRAMQLMGELGVTVPPHRKPGEVSGGQAQRIATCRALLASPSILLADEPTGNLDKRSATAVLDAFRRQADAGGCVVLVTHDPRVAARADAIATLQGAS